MSLDLDTKRYQYTLMLNKLIPQRTEYLASMFNTFPKIYGYVFVNIWKFDSIPKYFDEILFYMRKRAYLADGTAYGMCDSSLFFLIVFFQLD